jgi:hypothetical protein
MDFQELANLGEIIGAVAVVVSLAYLAIQVRQSTTAQQTENYVRTLDRLSTQQSRLGQNSADAVMFSKGVKNAAHLTSPEKIQFTWILYEMFDAFEFMFHASQNNAMPEEVWNRWSVTVAFWLKFPGVLTWWNVRPTPFTDSFTAFVDDLIENNPSPDIAGLAWSEFVNAGK